MFGFIKKAFFSGINNFKCKYVNYNSTKMYFDDYTRMQSKTTSC